MSKMLKAVNIQTEISAGKAIANISSRNKIKSVNISQGLQTKLSVGKPNDKYEQEADTVAEKVMAMSMPGTLQAKFSGNGNRSISAEPVIQMISPFIRIQSQEDKEEEEPVQTKPELHKQVEEEEEPVILKPNLNSEKSDENISEIALIRNTGAGSPLQENTRSFMESRFGASFRNVRIHTDSDAVRMNRSLNAQAFTRGNDIYFNNANYSPDSYTGRKLLAHELTHVLQQNNAVSHKKEDPDIMREVRGMVEPQREGTGLNDREWEIVRGALTNARRMVQRTLTFIRGVHNLLLPGFDPRLHSGRERQALVMVRAHYKNPGPVDGLELQEYFGYINTALNTLGRNSFRKVTDRQANEGSDGDTYAYVRGRDPVIYIAESYFTELAADEEYARPGARVSLGPRLLNDSQKARLLIHETAHFRLGVIHSGGVFGFDIENPVHGLPIRTAAQGLNNAYVYDHFAFCASGSGY